MCLRIVHARSPWRIVGDGVISRWVAWWSRDWVVRTICVAWVSWGLADIDGLMTPWRQARPKKGVVSGAVWVGVS